jgi:hypothetical protein
VTINAADLERATRRWWFTHRADDGVPLALLPQFTQNAIVADAIKIHTEETCTSA